MTHAELLFFLVTLCLTVLSSYSRIITNRGWSSYKTQITDFRYNTARIDGITKLYNGSLIVISNGHYWVLTNGQLPRAHNVKGSISQLYSGFKTIDAIWTDPYNDISPQIYLISNTAKHGLRVVCQEFNEEFSNDSGFCHLPVDNLWKNALKDIDSTKPIDAVTWRNRTKDKDGGFWVFFQGKKMITIDPYEMNLRFTYDIMKWMSINETISAAYYDYKDSVYHFFFDNNKYFTWKVNVSFMNSLPMSWDRAFLHGTLSRPMKINKHFFGFHDREIRDWSQPYYQTYNSSENDNDLVETSIKLKSSTSTTTTTPRRRLPYEYTTLRPNLKRTKPTEGSDISDVVHMTPRTKYIYNTNNRNEKIKSSQIEDDNEKTINSVEHEDSDLVSYQKQLMQLDQDGVRDFSDTARINSVQTVSASISCTIVATTLAILITHLKLLLSSTC